MDYDVAVVSFSGGGQIVLGPNAAVMPLPSSLGNNPLAGQMLIMAGWGIENTTSTSLSPVLREVKLPVVKDDTCKLTYAFLSPRQSCFGGTLSGQTGACRGDQGGAAVYDGIQYGIFSGTNDCEAPSVPGVYCKVTAVRDWITQWTGI